MEQKKKFRELTIKNNFMFGAVMCDENNCKEFLEIVLQIPIERVEVSKEKSIIYHPEHKGVRLDVYAKDAYNTHYDVEMQSIKKKSLGKRARYYHSQIDMELLRSGEDYDVLPNSYVIFVCDFDPFDKKKYCYTFENHCIEDMTLKQQDGCKTIFLSTYGENKEEVSERIVNFLGFVKADLEESNKDFGDEFVRKLQKTVHDIKESREMEERFIMFDLLLKEERADARAEGWAEGKAEGKAEGRAEGKAEGRAEGKAEGRAEGKAEGQLLGKIEFVLALLEDLGTVSEDVREKIQSETDVEKLGKWLKLAAKVESMEQFLNGM